MEEHTLEEVEWDNITYTQQSSASCMGCVFDDVVYGCLASKRFYTPCVINKTIWIKKENKMNTTMETQLNAETEFTAPNMLKRASDLMIERAVQYDSPEGERSMEKIVTAFNAITGKGLTESEGWMLMVLLKLVRDNTRAEGHQDSCEDLIAYGALYGESRLSNGQLY